MQIDKIQKLQRISAEARKMMVETLIKAGCGHPGGAFSCVDTLVDLYFEVLNIDPKNANWEERDRFILSKGHSSVGLYSVLHLRGFFDKDTLLSFRQDGSILGGHPDMHKVPGVEFSTGSLGHGLSVGVGLALSARMNQKEFKTFVMMGDGETQEGSVWEAAMSASHHGLDHLIGIVDRNRLQIDGSTEEILKLEPYADKWKAFGWSVRQVDGHDHKAVVSALKEAPYEKEKPSLLILDTVKGKGISFMENNYEWHGKALKGDEAVRAIQETTLFMEEK